MTHFLKKSLFVLVLFALAACGSDEESTAGHEEHASHDEADEHEGHDMADEHEGHDEADEHEGHDMVDEHEGHEAMDHEAMEAGALSTESVYHIGGSWTDQDGDSFELESLRGSATVVLFFYGSCEHVCPMLIRDVQGVEAALSPETLEHTRFLLVTIDPSTDTPEVRRAMAEAKGLSLERYTIVHSDEMHTRGLAALLGVQYRDNGDGQFSHSNIISLLDSSGVPVTRIEGLQQANEDFVRALGEVATDRADERE